MFTRLKGLYDSGRLTLDGLKNAVVKGWITEEEFLSISGSEYSV